MRESLRSFADGASAGSVLSGEIETNRKITFLFSGQGSQRPGMARTLYETNSVFRALIDEGEEISRPHMEQSLRSLLLEDSATLIHQTRYAQPALFVFEMALFRMLAAWGVEPDYVLGHSVGELTAACAGGALSFADGLRLVLERGRLMQSMPPGAMIAVFASEADVATAVGKYMDRVSIAAHNAPGEITLSGETDALNAVAGELRGRGLEVRNLTVSHAFHSPMMEPIMDDFERFAAGFYYARPKIPLLSNLTGEPLDVDPNDMPRYWREHIRRPVRFLESLNRLRRDECSIFLELGPGAALSGLGRRSAEGNELFLPTIGPDQEWSRLLRCLGILYTRGVTPDWAGFDRDYKRKHVGVPGYPFQRQEFVRRPSRTRAPDTPTGDHPFIQNVVRPADGEGTVCITECVVSLDTFPYMYDHCIEDAVVFPGAAYLEMVQGVCALLGRRDFILRNFEISTALFMVPEGRYRIQLKLTRNPDETYFYRITSREADADEEARWIARVSGVVEKNVVRNFSRDMDLEDVHRRCAEYVSPAEFYLMHKNRGNYWGPCFQGITAIHRSPGEALVEVVSPTELGYTGAYRFHPALIDACAQALSACMLDEDQSAFFADGVDAFYETAVAPGTKLFVHAILEEGDTQRVRTGRLRIHDTDGRIVGEVRGLRYRYIESSGTSPKRWTQTIRIVPAPERTASGNAPDQFVICSRNKKDQEIVSELQSRNVECVLVRPEEASDVLAAGGARSLGVVYSAGQAQTAEDECIGLLQFYQSLRGVGRPYRLWCLTRGAFALDEKETVRESQAALGGLMLSLGAEEPGLRPTLIDLEPGVTAAGPMVDELLGAGPNQVVLRGDTRYIPSFIIEETPLEGVEKLRFEADGTYLITGGMGGLGLLVAEWMARRGAGRLLLLGRRALDGEDERLAPLRAAGAQVRTVSADVGDRDALAAALDEELGADSRLRGVIHAAGAASRQALAELDSESLREGLGAKVQGSRNLREITDHLALDFFVYFSSASAITPSPLLGVYAAANACMDAMAHNDGAGGRGALSINWGPWSGAGMAADIDVDALAMGMIDPRNGLELLGALIGAGVTRMAVLPPARQQAASARQVTSASVSEFIQSVGGERNPDESQNLLREFILRELTAILRLPDPPPTDRAFPALGFDSLMAVELKNRIESETGLPIQVVDLLKGPSVDSLSAALAERIPVSETFRGDA